MFTTNRETWITQAEYAKKLRPLLPAEAFLPDLSKIWLLLINVAILLLGWGIARHLDRWSWYLLWLYLPLALIMGNSIAFLAFSTHDLLHNSIIRNSWLKQILSMPGCAILWSPPTYWKAVHNREHHNKTNSLHDPDRNYLYEQPNRWTKWVQNLIAPSSEVNLLAFTIGLPHAWGFYTFRNLISVLLFNNGLTEYAPAAFKVSPKERRAIALEFLLIIGVHLGILAYLGFHPVKLLLGYFLPIWIGYSGTIAYIYTHHILCRMTPVNDPLINSISIRLPKLFDVLHLNFSYHTEHHIFPGMNSDYYPLVQELLQAQYPDRLNLLSAAEVWRLMLQTPRHYKDENTFTDWAGENIVPCPLSIHD